MSVALMFPGQGAQVVGMGIALCERSERARHYFVVASNVLGYDLLDLCRSGPEEKLNSTAFSQPALFVHSMASLALLSEQKPDLMNQVTAVAGLSLGEYSALCAAGALDFEDGVKLVQARGAAMQAAAEITPSGMGSVLGLTLEQVEKLCNDARLEGEVLQVANLLCPGNIAISGHVGSLERAESMSEAAGAMKFIRLAVAGAFHTSLMQPAFETLSQAIASVPMRGARYPLVSNVDAQLHVHAEEFKALLPKQLISPVQWEGSLRQLLGLGVEQFYEVGVGRVLAGTLKRIDRKKPCECFGD